jgi:hypothetical protein
VWGGDGDEKLREGQMGWAYKDEYRKAEVIGKRN